MKTQKPKRTSKDQHERRQTPAVAPNRTIDESPADSQEMTRRTDLRDPIHAPGQLQPTARKDGIRADEYYGQTQIPDEESLPVPEQKAASKQSAPRTGKSSNR